MMIDSEFFLWSVRASWFGVCAASMVDSFDWMSFMHRPAGIGIGAVRAPYRPAFNRDKTAIIWSIRTRDRNEKMIDPGRLINQSTRGIRVSEEAELHVSQQQQHPQHRIHPSSSLIRVLQIGAACR